MSKSLRRLNEMTAMKLIQPRTPDRAADAFTSERVLNPQASFG